MKHYDNEDAGDLSITGHADYSAEHAEQRATARRERYLGAFDSIGAGYYRMVESSIGLVCDLTRCPGPQDAPYCEHCGRRLSRDDDGDYSAAWGLFFCGPDCREEHRCGPAHAEGREFPTYG